MNTGRGATGVESGVDGQVVRSWRQTISILGQHLCFNSFFTNVYWYKEWKSNAAKSSLCPLTLPNVLWSFLLIRTFWNLWWTSRVIIHPWVRMRNLRLDIYAIVKKVDKQSSVVDFLIPSWSLFPWVGCSAYREQLNNSRLYYSNPTGMIF